MREYSFTLGADKRAKSARALQERCLDATKMLEMAARDNCATVPGPIGIAARECTETATSIRYWFCFFKMIVRIPAGFSY